MKKCRFGGANMQARDQEYDFFGKLVVARQMSDFEQLAVPYLSGLFCTQSVLLVLFQQDARPDVVFRWIPNANIRQIFDTNYLDLGFMLDPFYLQCWKVEQSGCFLLRDIVPDRFENSEYFSVYFGSTHMVDDMGLVARLDKHSALHLSLGRHFGQRRYRARDLKHFSQISKVLLPKLLELLGQRSRQMTTRPASLKQCFIDRCGAMSKPISQREAEVAARIVQGHSSRSIGLHLGISIHTVKVHRRSLYRKLNITSQNELFGILTNITES